MIPAYLSCVFLLGQVSEPLEGLKRLEAQALTLQGPWTLERHRGRVALQADLMAFLSSLNSPHAEAFRRVALLTPELSDWATARQRYECLMVATALGDREAPQHLAGAWDRLMVAMGRRPRLGSLPIPRVAGEAYRPSLTVPPVLRVLLEPQKAPTDPPSKGVARRLKALVDADQAARQNEEPETPEAMEAGARADHQRRIQVRQWLAQARILTPEAYAHAALLMQHGSWFEDYALAHELALCATVLEPKQGAFLLAVTYDRMLQSVGFQQRVGTQYRGTGELDPVEAIGFTDAMRRALGRQPLAEIPKKLF